MLVLVFMLVLVIMFVHDNALLLSLLLCLDFGRFYDNWFRFGLRFRFRLDDSRFRGDSGGLLGGNFFLFAAASSDS